MHFFITREEPSTVPVTLWTTDPAPGINPIILLVHYFLPRQKKAQSLFLTDEIQKREKKSTCTPFDKKRKRPSHNLEIFCLF